MSEPFLGELKLISWNFPPKGWAFCNGQLLPINQNQALFSILGTTYGGDGQTNFALPDLRGRTPVYAGQGLTLGEKGGETAHTLNQSEMPQHAHTPAANTGAATVGALNNNFWSATGAYGAAGNSQMNATEIGATGGSQPHANMQPYLVINIIIALQGIFPSRN
jgi:microcystin-dependent protein